MPPVEPQAAPLPPPPPPPQASPSEAGLRARLERAEALIEELRGRLAADEKKSDEKISAAATKDDLKNAELRMTDIAAALEDFKRTFASEGELAARLAQAESAMAGLKTSFEGQELKLKTELPALASRDAADELRVNLAAALNTLNEMKLAMAQYAGEVSSLGSECRRALGEAQGLSKAALNAQTAPQAVDFMREAAAAMNTRLSELEVSVHASISEFSSRLGAGEVLINKVLASAEERLRKSFEPKFKDIDGQLRWIRENLLRLSDDYSVVAERKIRALEAKYSAFEAIARRMDAIDAALKKSGRIGLP